LYVYLVQFLTMNNNNNNNNKSRISSFAATAPLNAIVDPRHDKRRRALRDSQLSQAVAAKLEDGNVRAAVCLLMSEDSPAEPCSDSLEATRKTSAGHCQSR